MYERSKPTIPELRRKLVGDSIERGRLMSKFVALIRADERARTLDALGHARERASVGRTDEEA